MTTARLSILFCVILNFFACSKKTETAQTAAVRDETPPVLSTPFINPSLVTFFNNFGALIHGTDLNDNYEVYLSDRTSNVYASSPGVVVDVAYNVDQTGDDSFNQQDYEIHVKPNANSVWLIIYDHVREVTVSVGDTVTAGQILGTAGKNGGENAPEGRVELTVYKAKDGGGYTAYCPRSFGDSTFNAGFDTAVANHNAANPNSLLTSPCEREIIE